MTRIALSLISALMLLTGCALDQEEALRARLSAWVEVGETFFFESSADCTAAVFHTQAQRVSSLLPRARSIETGLAMLADGQPVLLAVAGRSPNALTEEIMSRDLPQGLGVLNAGLAGLGCMTDMVKSVYYRAIMNPASKLSMFPREGAMMVLDPQAQALLYVRGGG